jgi:hypothetical protein
MKKRETETRDLRRQSEIKFSFLLLRFLRRRHLTATFPMINSISKIKVSYTGSGLRSTEMAKILFSQVISQVKRQLIQLEEKNKKNFHITKLSENMPFMCVFKRLVHVSKLIIISFVALANSNGFLF